MGADKFRSSKSIHGWHPNVENDGREVGLEDLSERLLPGICPDQCLSERADPRLEDEEVFRLVIHEQDVHRRVGNHAFNPAMLRRPSSAASDLCGHSNSFLRIDKIFRGRHQFLESWP